MSDYHFFGIVAAATFMLTVLGLYFQLILVIKRRVLFLNNALENDRPTNVLSLNQLNSVFLACYSFYLYGICTTPINHYLAWPRLMAMGVLLFLFYQILIDRQNRWSKLVFFVAIFLLIASLSIFLFKEEVKDYGKYFAQGLVILATLVLAQGYLHQIIMIRRSGRTGAVSIRFHQCVLLTALSTVAFGFAIGIKNGWPLILLASVSTTLKVITLWHFRWVKISKIAELRRGKFIGL